MAHDDDKHSASERLNAMLALLADNEAPIGARPDLKEIQDWHLSELDETRAAEVKSYVARDPECFAMWSDLLAAEATAEQPVTQSWLALFIKKLTNWFTTRPSMTVTGGLATAMIVVLAIIIMPDPRSSWSPLDNPIYVDMEVEWPYLERTTRSEGELSYDQKVAMQSGIREGIQLTTQGKQDWAQVLEYLHDTIPSCEKSKDVTLCETQNKLLQKTGLHAAVLYLACVEREKSKTKLFNDEFWQNQSKAWKTLGNDLNKNNLTATSKFALALHKLEKDRDAQCLAVRDLIELAF